MFVIYDLSIYLVIYLKDVGLSDIFLNENNECIIYYLCKMLFEKRFKILEGICLILLEIFMDVNFYNLRSVLEFVMISYFLKG